MHFGVCQFIHELSILLLLQNVNKARFFIYCTKWMVTMVSIGSETFIQALGKETAAMRKVD